MEKSTHLSDKPSIIACDYWNLLNDFYELLDKFPRFVGQFGVRVVNFIKLDHDIAYYKISYRKRLPEELKTCKK